MAKYSSTTLYTLALASPGFSHEGYTVSIPASVPWGDFPDDEPLSLNLVFKEGLPLGNEQPLTHYKVSAPCRYVATANNGSPLSSTGEGRVYAGSYLYKYYWSTRPNYAEFGYKAYGPYPNRIESEEYLVYSCDVVAQGDYNPYTKTVTFELRSKTLADPAARVNFQSYYMRFDYSWPYKLAEIPSDPEYWKEYFLYSGLSGSIPADLRNEGITEVLNGLTCNTNNIANILSVADMLKAIVNPAASIDDFIEFVAEFALNKYSIADLWLKYRYLFCTTISDIKEWKRFLSVDPSIFHTHRYGKETSEFSYHLKFTLADRTLDRETSLYRGLCEEISRCWFDLKRVGLAPDLYNLWDLVPFSFIVDWFLPIGEHLEACSREWYSQAYAFSNIVDSIKRTLLVDVNGVTVTLTSYQRDVLSELPTYHYYRSEQTPSGKTVILRFIDALSLFIGRG